MSTKSLGKRKARDDDPGSNIKPSGDGHGSTLFVSNLPYDATSTDLQTAFSDLAPVRYAFVVLEPGTGVSKGIGYVSFSIKEDAKTAYEVIMKEGMSLNGRKVRVQWARRKDRANVEAKGKGKEKEESGDKSKEKARATKDKVKNDEEEVIGSSEHADDGNEIEVEDEEDGEGSEEDESGDEDEEEEGTDDAEGDEVDEEDDEDEDEIPERDDDDEAPQKPQLPHTDVGTTVFIRNIPFEATEDELRTLFRAFGPLRYVRMTFDPETERPRGTGFACFWKKEDADKVIEQSDILRKETMGTQIQPSKKNPFTLPSLLTPDPSASVAKNLVLQGRTLDVIRAVTRENATKLKEEGEKAREKADKRNLYLLREGVILPNTPAAGTISAAELEKRTNSFNARRTMLRTNPSLYVSKTRLSIRQIPLFVTERVLKRLAIHSVREFNAEVKKGAREGLTPDELVEPVKDDEETSRADVKEEDDAKPKKKGKSKGKVGRLTGVKQTKIVRQADRVDPITGKGRSRGYGFVEMHKHADALRILRWANNNPDVGALFDKWWKEELADLLKGEKAKEKPDEARIKRMKNEMEALSKPLKGTLIVEFSIENVQVVRRRAAQGEKSSQPQPRSHGSVRKPLSIYMTEEQPTKKRRLSRSDGTQPLDVRQSTKPGQLIGSVIGRKRRARKTGKGAR